MKKIFSLFLSVFMFASLVACGGSKNNDNEQPPKQEEKVEPEKTSDYVIENEIVKIEIDEPTTIEDVDVPVLKCTVTNLINEKIIVNGVEVQPKQKTEGNPFFYELYEDEESCGMYVDVCDSQRNTISTILFNVGLDKENKISSFEITNNTAVSLALIHALKIEQIADASLVVDGKDVCGETYHSEALLKITNTSDITILVVGNSFEGIVLKPGESTEFGGSHYNSACDAVLELPFTVEIQYFEYKDSDVPYDYDFFEAAHQTFEITH